MNAGLPVKPEGGAFAAAALFQEVVCLANL